MRSEQAVSAIRMLLPILARFALESTSLRISSRNHISLVAALGEPQIFWGDRGRQQVQRYAFQISAVRDEASAMREERAGCVLEKQLCYFSVDRGSLFAIHHRTSRARQTIHLFIRIRAYEQIAIARVEEHVCEIVRIGIIGVPVAACDWNRTQSQTAFEFLCIHITEVGADSNRSKVVLQALDC